MPELPEVETVRRSLELHLEGTRIRSVSGRSIQMRRWLDVERLAEALTGDRFLRFRRRGKFLLLDLASGGSLLLHLGMSGRFLLEESDWPLRPHTHLRLHLEDGRELRFCDPRRFGFADWLDEGEEASDPSLLRLGLEPLDPQMPRRLPLRLKQRRAPLKSLLLDQSLVAGVGNIYAAEALWRAGIHPARRGDRTSATRLEALCRHVRDVLQEAIEQGGTTLRDYATLDGSAGYFAVHLAVYGRAGQPCPTCASRLRQTQIGGRSTVYCARCQR